MEAWKGEAKVSGINVVPGPRSNKSPVCGVGSNASLTIRWCMIESQMRVGFQDNMNRGDLLASVCRGNGARSARVSSWDQKGKRASLALVCQELHVSRLLRGVKGGNEDAFVIMPGETALIADLDGQVAGFFNGKNYPNGPQTRGNNPYLDDPDVSQVSRTVNTANNLQSGQRLAPYRSTDDWNF